VTSPSAFVTSSPTFAKNSRTGLPFAWSASSPYT
jgi:hypothetical protein